MRKINCCCAKGEVLSLPVVCSMLTPKKELKEGDKACGWEAWQIKPLGNPVSVNHLPPNTCASLLNLPWNCERAELYTLCIWSWSLIEVHKIHLGSFENSVGSSHSTGCTWMWVKTSHGWGEREETPFDMAFGIHQKLGICYAELDSPWKTKPSSSLSSSNLWQAATLCNMRFLFRPLIRDQTV